MPKSKAKSVPLIAESLEVFLKLTTNTRTDWKFKPEDVGGPWFLFVMKTMTSTLFARFPRMKN